jgi:hypothetical protein
LSSLKLNKLGIDDSPIPIIGFFFLYSFPFHSLIVSFFSQQLCKINIF